MFTGFQSIYREKVTRIAFIHSFLALMKTICYFNDIIIFILKRVHDDQNPLRINK